MLKKKEKRNLFQSVGCLLITIMMMFSLFACQSAEEKARLEEIAKRVAMTNEELEKIGTELTKYDIETIAVEDRELLMIIKSDLDAINLEYKCESVDCKDKHSEDCPEIKMGNLYATLGTVLAKVDQLQSDVYVKAEAERIAKEKAEAEAKAKADAEAKKKEEEDRYVASNNSGSSGGGSSSSGGSSGGSSSSSNSGSSSSGGGDNWWENATFEGEDIVENYCQSCGCVYYDDGWCPNGCQDGIEE